MLLLRVGYRTATALPVCSGVALTFAAQHSRRAGQLVRRRLAASLLSAVDQPIDVAAPGIETRAVPLQGEEDDTNSCGLVGVRLATKRRRIPPAILDELMTRDLDCCSPHSCTPSAGHSVTIRYRLDRRAVLQVPPAAFEESIQVLFNEDVDSKVDQLGMSLPRLIAEVLLKCPIDDRVVLAQNIVLCGGMARVTGFAEALRGSVARLIAGATGQRQGPDQEHSDETQKKKKKDEEDEVDDEDPDQRFASLSALSSQIRVRLVPAYDASALLWTGGSLVGSLQHRDGVCGTRLITADQFRALSQQAAAEVERESGSQAQTEVEAAAEDHEAGGGEGGGGGSEQSAAEDDDADAQASKVDLEDLLSSGSVGTASSNGGRAADPQLRTRIRPSALSSLRRLFPDPDTLVVQ